VRGMGVGGIAPFAPGKFMIRWEEDSALPGWSPGGRAVRGAGWRALALRCYGPEKYRQAAFGKNGRSAVKPKIAAQVADAWIEVRIEVTFAPRPHLPGVSSLTRNSASPAILSTRGRSGTGTTQGFPKDCERLRRSSPPSKARVSPHAQRIAASNGGCRITQCVASAAVAQIARAMGPAASFPAASFPWTG